MKVKIMNINNFREIIINIKKEALKQLRQRLEKTDYMIIEIEEA